MERIAKFIARCGVASRRKAEDLISAGLVRLNGEIVTELGTKVDPMQDSVKVRQKRIALTPRMYVLFNKPKGVITTKQDTHERKTVVDLLPKKYRDLHPVGRLDKDTTGLILFTNDGALTYALTHPRYRVTKSYDVVINAEPTPQAIGRLQQGIQLEDGRTQPAEVVIVKRGKRRTSLTVRIKEGRKRQIRRMFQAVGYKVIALERTRMATLSLGGLREGAYRELRQSELTELRKAIDGTQ